MNAAVSLCDVDPELTAGIPDDDHDLARRVLVRPRYDIPKGRWLPELLKGHDQGAFAILVVDGALMRQLDVAERHCLQLLGPGDVLQPPAGGGIFEFPITWTALRPSAVVVLDDRFTRAAQRWPSLGLNLHRRLLDQADRIALLAAIAQLPRVEERVLAVLWHLADRWGRVTPFGVEVPLELTHELLGRFVGARRPTVTLALGELAEHGAVKRVPGMGWLLDPTSQDTLRPTAPPATIAAAR
jgi:CRP/FNR family transcriptional regulator, cyclic AMP receptor protein